MKAERSPDAAAPSASVDPRFQKLRWALGIMGLGMLIAMAWNAWQGWVLGRGYPDNTFLFNPVVRFSDWSDCLIIARQPNPYSDPIARYPPFTWLCLRPISTLGPLTGMIAFFYAGMAGLFLLLVGALRDIIAKPMSLVFTSLFAMMICYPVLICFDRGNLELELAPMIGGAIYFIARAKYIPAMLCLIPAICLKVYPVLFLALFIRQGKMAATIITLAAFVVISLLSLWQFSLSPQEAWAFYQRNSECDADIYIYGLSSLEACASPWNALAIVLKGAGILGLIAPVDFSYDSISVHRIYAVYSAGMLLLAVIVAAYVCLLEKEFARAVMVLLLFVTVLVPSGGDNRLIYAGMALVLLVISRTARPRDFAVLILLALVMVPIKEVHLGFAGRTEGGFNDVPIAALLDPIFVLVSMALLINDSRASFDWRWSRLRTRRLMRAVIPWLPARLGPASARP